MSQHDSKYTATNHMPQSYITTHAFNNLDHINKGNYQRITHVHRITQNQKPNSSYKSFSLSQAS